MGYRDILGRIRTTLTGDAYLAGTDGVPDDQHPAMREIASLVADAHVPADQVRARIQQLHASGRIDRTMKLSALGVLAASPRVHDLAEASRLAGQQELAAMEADPERRAGYLASVHRHRGVIAFLAGHPEVALDHFARALDHVRSAQDLGNVLACLVRLGDLPAARRLQQDVARGGDAALRDALLQVVERDADLVALRPVAGQGTAGRA